MKLSRSIIEQLDRVCGLKATETETIVPPDCDGVFIDRENGRSVFAVAYGGKTYAFEIDGCSEALAKLAREYVLSMLANLAEPAEAFRVFLDGGAAPVGVHVGKADYYVYALYGDGQNGGLYDYITAVADPDDFVVNMGDGITAFCKLAGSDNDYRSAGEFAVVLIENIAEETNEHVKIGIGGVAHGVSELPQYYKYACMALVGGAEFDPSGAIYSYKDYALDRILSELPKPTMEKYIKIALDKNYSEVLSDTELMTAADAFLKHSLNISEAARSMYVHRNTLIYRLDKIERMTGLDIRNFGDALTFRVAYLIYKNL